MKVVVTGADGFVGWHLRARLQAFTRHHVVPLGRSAFADRIELTEAVATADAVVHLAGVNRGEVDEVEQGNLALADGLVSALDAGGNLARVIYANSIHAGTDTPYGRGKQAASDRLAAWAARRGATYVDVALPNLYGEGGKPYFNSFVATFCHRLSQGEAPYIDEDRVVPLMHTQDAADVIIGLLSGDIPRVLRPDGRPSQVTEVAGLLEDLATTYRRGDVPDLTDPFALRMFNTYRSFLHPHWFPQTLEKKSDARGAFCEVLRSSGGGGQISFSTTLPGMTRGDHFHVRKFERFSVLRGRAEIAIRPVGKSGVTVFEVRGDQPSFVDMPTLHTHSITNIGDDEMLAVFWISEAYDPHDPDTFPEPVR